MKLSILFPMSLRNDGSSRSHSLFTSGVKGSVGHWRTGDKLSAVVKEALADEEMWVSSSVGAASSVLSSWTAETLGRRFTELPTALGHRGVRRGVWCVACQWDGV